MMNEWYDMWMPADCMFCAVSDSEDFFQSLFTLRPMLPVTQKEVKGTPAGNVPDGFVYRPKRPP